MTHIEALDLDRVPTHLVIIGGGYVGLEMAQAARRFGSRVNVIERGPQLAGREDPDVGAALLELFEDEGIEVLLKTAVNRVEADAGTAAVHGVARCHFHAPDSGGRTDVLLADVRSKS
jgi:pyruvate/2-oxoglutarate dehydrogenase complex dihydrolipoamide dehydrogenase (E3) component